MADFDKKVSDWQVKCYLDLGAAALVAGYLCHMRLYSPTLKESVHGVYGGLGIGIQAGIDAHGAVQALDKAGGLTDKIPSAGMDMKTIVMKPFSMRDLNMCVASIFTAGVAAIAAPADAKVIQLGSFCQAVEAKATIKLAVEVGSSWTGGFFAVISPKMNERPEVVNERLYRTSASQPLYITGSMK